MTKKRLTKAHTRVHSRATMTATLNPSQIEPRPPAKLRARLPARAMDNGSQAAAAVRVARATARSAEPGELRRTGNAAAETSPISARALPTGRPPGKAY